MARISGLASDHHPVGPGDAPRRKKSRKSTPSVDLSQGSKRAASASVEPAQPKRKRVQLDDTEQLARELEESVDRSQSQATDGNIENHFNDHRNRRHSAPARNASDEEDEEDDSQNTPPPETQPLPGLTPHLERLGAPRGRPSNARRARMSMPAQLHLDPVDDNIDDKELQFAPLSAVLDGRTRRRLRRNHLSQEVNEIENHHKEDKKLRKEFLELQRRLQEKDSAIAELEYQLESRRLGNIVLTDDHAEELERELAQARQEIDELRASSIYNGDSCEQSAIDGQVDGLDGLGDLDEDEDGLMLIEPDDVHDTQAEMHIKSLPNGEYAARAMELSSQVTVETVRTMTQTTHDVLVESPPSSLPDKISEQAVMRYEGEINQLIKDLGQSQGALRVIAVELQNLCVVQPGASSDVIITKLREGFESVREQLENLLPDCTAGLTNGELLHKIPGLFEGLLQELRAKVVESNTHYKKSQSMQHQYEHVLDLLARSEDHNDDLETNVKDLDHSDKEKQQTIVELEERVTTLDNLANGQDAQIKQNTAEINGLNDEVRDKDTALERLRASLETYRDDLDKVTATTTRLEEDHRQTMADMEQAHADTVRELEIELADEKEGRMRAEGEAEQNSEYIDALEADIQRIEGEVNEMSTEMQKLRELLANETEGRETAEDQRDEQSKLAYDRANNIENLNEQIQDLEQQVEDLRTNLETERRQREETEQSLEQANADINDLNDRLHDAGIQANELRTKLFQVQQEKEEQIATLEEDAGERERLLKEDLDAEIQGRDEAEQQVTNLEAQITQLEKDIDGLNNSITEMTEARDVLEKDRDDRTADLNAQLENLKQKYTALENASKSTETTLQASITDLTNEINDQKAEIERITNDAAATQRNLQGEVATKDEQIETLESDLDASRAENGELLKQKQSLEERVNNLSEDYLTTSAAHADERDALKMAIDTQEATIRTLQDKAEQRAADYATAMSEKEEEIQDLRMMGDARATHIVALEGQIEDVKERFATAEEDTRTTIDALTRSHRELQEQNENLAAALKKRNADTLKAVNEMKVMGVEVKSKTVDLHKVANGKVAKVSERVKVSKRGGKKKEKVTKRQFGDSGIGLDMDEDIDELGAEAIVG